MMGRVFVCFFSVYIFAFPVFSFGMQEKTDPVLELLLQGIDANFSGDYDRAWTIFAKIGEIDPNHPAMEFYQAVVLFWRTNIDSSNSQYDAMIEKLLQKSIDKGENWLERDANNLDALHYIGISYTYLGRLEAHRGNLYSGGMKGETGRKYLERAIVICRDMPCPSGIEDTNECEPCEEIYFPHGAYSYFAGRLPGLLKLFSFLWFIPHGSTEEGLSELERAAKNARLHSLGSRILLANIYALFEKGHLDRSLSISSELVKRYPNNSYLDLGHAKFLVLAGHYDEAIERSESIIQKATENKISYENIAKLGAQLVIAEAAIRKNKLNQAEKLLLELSGDPASQNNTLTSQIPLLQGMLADLKGKREQAVQFYQETKAHEGRTRNRATSKGADKYLDQPFTPEGT